MQTWTQSVYGWIFSFPSPIRQNHRHIKVLEWLLELPYEVFNSIIVFTGDCTFKNEMPDEVCTLWDLIEYIHSIDTRILTTEHSESICRDLKHLRLKPSGRTHREHVADLRRRHETASQLAPATRVARPGRADAFVEAAAS